MYRLSFYSLLVALFLVLLSFSACDGEKIQTQDLKATLDTLYMMRTDSVNMLVSDSGVVKYRMESELWYIYDQPERKEWFFPKGIRIEDYDSLRRSTSFIVADTAIQYVDREEWELRGHVRIHRKSGDRIYTPSLHWLRKEHKLFSNDTTYFYTAGRELRGDRFEAKDDLSWYNIYNNRGTFEYDDTKRPTQTSSDTTQTSH